MSWLNIVAWASAIYAVVCGIGYIDTNPTAASWAFGYALWALCTIVVNRTTGESCERFKFWRCSRNVNAAEN